VPELNPLFDRLAAFSPAGASVVLPGPTGERNTYSVLPRRAILCLASDDRDLMTQVATVLAVGARAVLPREDRSDRMARLLPPQAARAVSIAAGDWMDPKVAFDAVLHHGTPEGSRELVKKIARREGPIVGVHAAEPGDEDLPLERLLVERVVSVNTAAAGGNASLMTVG
jgi:RHH-type proline utilization regulon transcriptional repressor/proline dehydrogenase/delta 1-pyrroline-5-carboxylate dehydrogenase